MRINDATDDAELDREVSLIPRRQKRPQQFERMADSALRELLPAYETMEKYSDYENGQKAT